MDEVLVEARDLTLQAGGRLVQQGLAFDIRHGEVLVHRRRQRLRQEHAAAPPGGPGSAAVAGQVRYRGQDLHRGDDETLAALRRRFGVMFQAGALWSSMTLGENLMLPMRLFTRWKAAERRRRAEFNLALVGLDGGFGLWPAQLSGGMRKRAALARALALEPELLYLDEPGSGLDPVNAARLDELVLHLRRDLGTSVVMVTHEVASVMAVADRALFLDATTRTMTALAPPAQLLAQGPPAVQQFLRREAAIDVAGAAT
jgi:phospholipid/cholesterol/gamma-HCH transport system ATP-binding protein